MTHPKKQNGDYNPQNCDEMQKRISNLFPPYHGIGICVGVDLIIVDGGGGHGTECEVKKKGGGCGG